LGFATTASKHSTAGRWALPHLGQHRPRVILRILARWCQCLVARSHGGTSALGVTLGALPDIYICQNIDMYIVTVQFVLDPDADWPRKCLDPGALKINTPHTRPSRVRAKRISNYSTLLQKTQMVYLVKEFVHFAHLPRP